MLGQFERRRIIADVDVRVGREDGGGSVRSAEVKGNGVLKEIIAIVFRLGLCHFIALA